MIDLAVLRAWADETVTNEPLGVAVSGGGDSVALLRVLAVDLALPIVAATVNHGLRASAAAEAAAVGRMCRNLGLDHAVLDVDVAAGSNLQARARDARYSALGAWARAKGVSQVALGHTQDDQAETFLLRLARGSGVAGLSGMAASVHRGGITWLRPLLGHTRTDLRAYLHAAGLAWAEDPSNEDRTFGRIRMRQALPELADLGLTIDGLAATADRMGRSAAVLDWAVDQAWKACGETVLGCAKIDMEKLGAFPQDTQTRMFAQLIQGIGNAIYPPRYDGLVGFLNHAKGATLAGVQSQRDGPYLWLFRESAVVADHWVPADKVWDSRWRFKAADPAAKVGSLGPKGQAELRDSLPDLPFGARCSLPGIWSRGTLVEGPKGAALIRPVRHS